MKKLISLLLALMMMLTLAACGGSSTNQSETPSSGDNSAAEDNADGDTAAAPAGGSSIAVCLASEPDTLDPALNSTVDGATMCAHLFSGLAGYAQDENGNLVLVPDCAEELVEGVVNEDGTVTYTYTLRDGLAWSDGQPMTAQDFVYSWNRAASVALGADYGYMFEIVDGYAEVTEADAEGNPVNPDATLNVSAPDDKTLVVTISNAVSYWNELLAFPAFFPVREDVVSDESWATSPDTYVCNGPYTMSSWEHNSVITLTKNPNYYNADTVTMDTIECYLSDDTNNMLANFQNGSWQLIDDVPTSEIANLKAQYPDQFFCVGQIGTYYVCWNINQNILPASSTLTGVEAVQAQSEIRNAFSLLLDRNYVVEEIAQGGQVPASSFVAMGLTDADGTQFYENAGNSDSYIGYLDVSTEAYSDNCAQAVEILKQYYTYDEANGVFTDVPTLEYLYNTSDAHMAIGEYIQSALSVYGINVSLVNQEWNTFLNTRKDGGYTMARNGWLADYNDPISFLDLWASVSGNDDCQFGKGEHKDLAMYSLDLTPYGIDIQVENGTWAETYDVLISQIKACTDNEARYAMMHLAEDMLMSTGCLTPLYFYTDLYMLDSSVQGFYSNPLGYKYFMHVTYAE